MAYSRTEYEKNYQAAHDAGHAMVTATPQEMVGYIHYICNWIGSTLTDADLMLLEKIADAELFFGSKRLEFLIGVEEEFNLIADQEDVPATSDTAIADFAGAHIRHDIFRAIYTNCEMAEMSTDAKNITRPDALFEIGFEPGMKSINETRTIPLSPLKAIFITKLAQFLVATEMVCGDVAKDYDFTRITNHVHYSLTNRRQQPTGFGGLTRYIDAAVLDTARAGLPLLISPEQREFRELCAHTPNIIAIGNYKSYVIVPHEDEDNIHSELRLCPTGEPKTKVDDRIIGIDPLIASVAVLSVGAVRGYKNLRRYLSKKITCDEEEKVYGLCEDGKHASIQNDTFAEWFERMQESPIMYDGFGIDGMKMLCDALIEQNPFLAEQPLASPTINKGATERETAISRLLIRGGKDDCSPDPLAGKLSR